MKKVAPRDMKETADLNLSLLELFKVDLSDKREATQPMKPIT